MRALRDGDHLFRLKTTSVPIDADRQVQSMTTRRSTTGSDRCGAFRDFSRSGGL